MAAEPKIELFNADWRDILPRYESNWFDLAIVDPPYFDGPQKPGYYAGTKQRTDVGEYKSLKDSWEVPGQDYIDEVVRVSKNQIIWGINYFDVKMPGGRIIWIKGQEGSPFSMADVAYHSFYNRIDIFKHIWAGFWQEPGRKREKRIHPTQKPVALYRWLLQNYANEGDKILDTHLGSGSIAIACYEERFDLVACEIDEEYYTDMKKRFSEYKKQLQLF